MSHQQSEEKKTGLPDPRQDSGDEETSLPDRLRGLLDRLASANLDPLLKTREMAAYLDITERTAEAWRTRGGGPKFVRCSKRMVRYRLSDVTKFVESRIRRSTSDRGGA